MYCVAERSAHQSPVIVGAMRYILFILGMISFVIWDVNMNRANFTKPVAHLAYRIAGGH